MNDPVHAKAMLERARADLNALRGMLADDATLFADAVFGLHAQQAVEKSLKAWIAHHGRKYPREHDIQLLIELLQGLGEDVAPFADLANLNLYAVSAR